MPNGSNSAAMRASGRTKRGQHSQSIEPSRPTKAAYLQSPNLLGNERARVLGTRANLRAKEKVERQCGGQSQDANKRLKLLLGARPVLPTADRTISRKTNCPRTFLLSEAFRVRLACVWMSGIMQVFGRRPHERLESTSCRHPKTCTKPAIK
jgi:hypothetical protein